MELNGWRRRRVSGVDDGGQIRLRSADNESISFLSSSKRVYSKQANYVVFVSAFHLTPRRKRLF